VDIEWLSLESEMTAWYDTIQSVMNENKMGKVGVGFGMRYIDVSSVFLGGMLFLTFSSWRTVFVWRTKR